MMSVGVVGAGIAGTSHLFDLASSEKFRVAAVCTRTLEHATAAADRFGVTSAYDDITKMLDCELVDGVVIALPPRAAPAALRIAVSRGLATLIDKPTASSPAALRRAIPPAARSAARVAIAYNRRYQQHVRAARDLLAMATIGDVTDVDCRWTGPFRERFESAETYRRDARRGEGVLLDNVSHILDTVHFLGFSHLNVEYASLKRGAGPADIAADILLRHREADTPIRVDVHDGPLMWRIAIAGGVGRFLLDGDGLWVERNGNRAFVPAGEVCRPVDDLHALFHCLPITGAHIGDALAVLNTIHDIRDAAQPATWKRPRAKALGRLNGAC